MSPRSDQPRRQWFTAKYTLDMLAEYAGGPGRARPSSPGCRSPITSIALQDATRHPAFVPTD